MATKLCVLFRTISFVVILGMTFGLTLAGEKKPKPTVPNSAGTQAYMIQLGSLFTKWDRNGDTKIDKQELATTFRGVGTKPFDFVPEGKTAGPPQVLRALS